MATIEAETTNSAILITPEEATPGARTSNYEPVRSNAMKHSIRSAGNWAP